VLLYTGVPNPNQQHPAGQPPPPPLVKGLETGLLPAMDEGAFTVDYFAPAGVPLEETVARARVVEGILIANPDVQGFIRRAGSEMGVFATQTNKGDIHVSLRPPEDDPISLLTKSVRPPLDELKKELKKQGKQLDEKEREIIRKQYRRRSTQDVMDEIDDEIKARFSEHQLQHEMMQIMQDELGDLAGEGKPIEIQIYGPDQSVLRRLAQQVADKLEEKDTDHALDGINSNVTAGNADLPITVDQQEAGRLGLTPEAVRRQMAAMFTGQIAAQAPESSVRITNVRVRYPDALRFGSGWFDPSLVLRQWVLLPEGNASAPGAPQGPGRSVPLSALARVTPGRTPIVLWRENQQPAAFVTAELNEQQAGLGTVAANVPHWLSDVHFPAGYRWELGGHILQQQAAFTSLAEVMVTAVLLVYVMLAFQFRSVLLPLLIFLTQPLSIVSGMLALYITGTPLNVSSYMGAILLVGLDMKNGILLVEYIQKLRAEGMALRPALLLAGHTRFRPILMTSLAAILGLAPLAFGIGPGAQMQQPLAIMVIGGLTANMLFTRAVIPAGYEVLERLLGRQTEGVKVAPAAVPIAAPPQVVKV
jgi:multidrug efflux pump subunit AcrB